jgi:hypothetical protein
MNRDLLRENAHTRVFFRGGNCARRTDLDFCLWVQVIGKEIKGNNFFGGTEDGK